MNSKNIIRKGSWLFLIICLIFPGRLQSSKFSFKLSYGLSYSAGGDTNDYLKSYYINYSMNKPFDYLHFGGDLSGEIYFQLQPRISIFVRTGLISASLKKNRNIKNHVVYSFDNSIYAIPLVLGIKYNLTSGRLKESLPPKLMIFLKAGLGYYLTTWNMTSDYAFSHYWTKIRQSANANNFGVSGAVGTEIRLSRLLSFIIEASGRYLRVDEFQGEYKYSTSDSEYPDLPIKGLLYYYEYAYFKKSIWQQELRICGKPVGNGVRNVRPATVDFSGFSICFGFKINL